MCANCAKVAQLAIYCDDDAQLMTLFTKKFVTLQRVQNSTPSCIFLTLMHQCEENCSTNMQLNFTQTFVSHPVIG